MLAFLGRRLNYLSDKARKMESVDPGNFIGLFNRVSLVTRVAALEIYISGDGHTHSGMIAEIPEGAELEICGEGFNHRTVMAQWKKKRYYVYLRDLRDQSAEAQEV